MKNNYQNKIKQEAKFWDSLDAHIFSRDESDYFPKEIIEYMNESFTGSINLPWWKFLKQYGAFEHGISLGCGTGFIEKRIMDEGICAEMDLVDISEGALTEARKRLHHLKCNFYQEDINSIKIQENKYDFILGHTSFHHFTNLEHIANEIQRALKPEGVFVLYDYVGEKRLRWDQKKIDFASQLIKVFPLLYRLNIPVLVDQFLSPIQRLKFLLKNPVVRKIERVPIEKISPFEAIRSDETLDILNKRFNAIHLKTINWIFLLMMANNIPLKRIKDPELMRFICDIDRLLSKNEFFLNMLAFGVYKHNVN